MMKIGSLVELVEDYRPELKHLASLLEMVLPTLRTPYVVEDVQMLDGEEQIALSETGTIFCTITGEYVYHPAKMFRELQPPMDMSEIIEMQMTDSNHTYSA